MIQLTFTNLIFILLALIGGFSGLVKIIAVLFERSMKRDLNEQFKLQKVANDAHHLQVNTRLTALDSAVKDDAKQWLRVERELLSLKAEMPLHYVRREDYIRGQSVLEAKLDGLVMKIENVQLRAQQNNS